MVRGRGTRDAYVVEVGEVAYISVLEVIRQADGELLPAKHLSRVRSKGLAIGRGLPWQSFQTRLLRCDGRS